MVQYLHFRILEFPMKNGDKKPCVFFRSKLFRWEITHSRGDLPVQVRLPIHNNMSLFQSGEHSENSNSKREHDNYHDIIINNYCYF